MTHWEQKRIKSFPLSTVAVPVFKPVFDNVYRRRRLGNLYPRKHEKDQSDNSQECTVPPVKLIPKDIVFREKTGPYNAEIIFHSLDNELQSFLWAVYPNITLASAWLTSKRMEVIRFTLDRLVAPEKTRPSLRRYDVAAITRNSQTTPQVQKRTTSDVMQVVMCIRWAEVKGYERPLTHSLRRGGQMLLYSGFTWTDLSPARTSQLSARFRSLSLSLSDPFISSPSRVLRREL